jgi:hypothetical protein
MYAVYPLPVWADRQRVTGWVTHRALTDLYVFRALVTVVASSVGTVTVVQR